MTPTLRRTSAACVTAVCTSSNIGSSCHASRSGRRQDSEVNGGVPRFGHKTHLRIFIDPDLLQYEEVWAAAGTWHDGFGIEPHKLVEASEGFVTDLQRN
jgi:hypothetical protein